MDLPGAGPAGGHDEGIREGDQHGTGTGIALSRAGAGPAGKKKQPNRTGCRRGSREKVPVILASIQYEGSVGAAYVAADGGDPILYQGGGTRPQGSESGAGT